ncbi:Oidioi.mRNA.OKI2018_I69.PAR.g10909.t1.cds [Oikopleura dioica]|uniref:Oidioi.mRNA.OKI2018_I69.PAR.g10909.t1.cds n=1 Tax=Oikopleura dioica TaxID=34765 RepID=A0ABN7RWC6_OIKDI|nr:Oidioi.mRNA.OKI2018_I69.PAR.g10909.t1.cds [Oikopleura dioica]
MTNVELVCEILDQFGFESDPVASLEKNIQQTEEEINKLNDQISEFTNEAKELAEKSSELSEKTRESENSQLVELESSHKALLIHILFNELEQISSDIKDSSENFSKATEHYSKLRKLCSSISATEASGVKDYVDEYCRTWQRALTEPLEQAVAVELAKLGFPDKLKENKYTKADTKALKNQLCRLDDLNLPKHLASGQKAAIVALVAPLRKKFSIFFYSANSKLNDPAKPEYFLSIIYKWINEYQNFITTIAEEIFDEFSASIEFVAELLRIAARKVEDDFELELDDEVFSHIIDEIISNDAELQLFEPTIAEMHRPLAILEHDDIAARWVGLELVSSRKMLEEIISGEFPIKSEEVAMQFFDILQLTNRRCQCLSQKTRTKFYFQELEIIDEFRLGLIQLSDVGSISLDKVCAIVNTISCIRTSLIVWEEDRPYAQPLRDSPRFQEKYDQVIANVLAFETALTKQIVNNAYQDISDALYAYNAGKLAHIKELEQVSSSLLPSLSKIQIHLQLLETNLLPEKSRQTCEQLAIEVDKHLAKKLVSFETIVTSNPLVSSQIESDLLHNVFSLFSNSLHGSAEEKVKSFMNRIIRNGGLKISIRRYATDPFKILGVSRNMSKKQIHTEYLRKCMKCHPDIFPDDPVKAQEFQNLQAAYDKIMNWEEHQQFETKQKMEQERQEEREKRQERPSTNWFSNPTANEWDPDRLRFGDSIIENNIDKGYKQRAFGGVSQIRTDLGKDGFRGPERQYQNLDFNRRYGKEVIDDDVGLFGAAWRGVKNKFASKK